MRHRLLVLVGLALVACADNAWGPADGGDDGDVDGGDADTDGDSDADAGGDSDADADSDPDGDEDRDGELDADAPLGPCEPIPGASYATLSREGPPTDRRPPDHADLNMLLRGWEPTGGALGLIDIPPSPDDDPRAPQLYTLFSDDRTPAFTQNYRVYDWDWSCDCRGGIADDFEVTVAGFGTTPGEVLEVPDGGYDIGGGLEVRVLYVDETSITLKYTREDNVVSGYTVHVEGVCVDPALVALYRECDERFPFGDSRYREELPALRGDQPFGRARGTEVRVAIRDTGRFMDPRTRKDWWIGR